MPSPREIASGFIRIFVRKDTLKSDLKQTEQEVAASAQKMEQSAEKASGSFSKMGESIRRTVGAPIVAAIAGVVAALGAVVAVTERVIRAWGEAHAVSKELQDSINATTKASNAYLDSLRGIEQTQGQAVAGRIREQIAAIQEEIDKLTDPNRPSLAGLMESIVGGRIPMMKEEQARLMRQLAEVEKADRNKREAEARAARYAEWEKEAADYWDHLRAMAKAEDRMREEKRQKDEAALRAQTEAAMEAFRQQQAMQADAIRNLQSVMGGGNGSYDQRILANVIEDLARTVQAIRPPL